MNGRAGEIGRRSRRVRRGRNRKGDFLLNLVSGAGPLVQMR